MRAPAGRSRDDMASIVALAGTARLVAALAALALASAAGWHARAVVAERDALRDLEVARRAAEHSQRAANSAALRYLDQRDRLAPVVRTIWREADPVVRVLGSCDMPADAGRLLDAAADAADCRASDCAAVPGRAAPGDGGSDIAARDGR